MVLKLVKPQIELNLFPGSCPSLVEIDDIALTFIDSLISLTQLVNAALPKW